MAVDFKDYTRKMDRTLVILQEDFGAIRPPLILRSSF